MITYSIWNFTKFNKLEDFLNTIKAAKTVIRTTCKNCTQYELKNELIGYEESSNISIQTIDLLGKSINFIAMKSKLQIVKHNSENDIYEINDVYEKIIAFEKNNSIEVVILASKIRAHRVIKKIFDNGLLWGIIEEENFVSEDMLYWLFFRLRELPDQAITINPEMYLNGIVSYLGRTNDKINAVRGRGTRVSALLGTLGMLLGEESLRALRPMIQYDSEEISIELFIGNCGKIYPKTYMGTMNILNDDSFSDIQLVLLVCGYILPNIKKGYKDSCSKQEWSIYIKQNFLRTVGNEMLDKIDKEMKKIENDIRMYEEDNGVLFEDDDEDELSEEEFFEEEFEEE